jgi:hypothetical protein
MNSDDHNNKNNLASSRMLLRIRTNLGTWKQTVDPSQRLSTIVDQMGNTACRRGWKMTTPPSRDPSGTQLLNLDCSLQELGLTNHGDMIYGRVVTVEDDVDHDHNDEPGEIDRTETKPVAPGVCSSSLWAASLNQGGNTPITAQKTKACSPLVIDLVDSDDDDDDHFEKKVAPVPPPEAAASRKRSSLSLLDGAVRGTKKTKSRQDMAPAPANNNKKFQVVSYNVWFGPPDPEARQVHPQQRMAAIGQELKSCHDNLVVVGFQELTPSLKESLAPILTSMDFRLCTQPLGEGASPYGVGLAIAKHLDIVEVKFIPFSNSCQGRGLLFIQTPTFLFATTHLESFMDQQTYNGAAQREAQIVQATIFCERRMEEYPQLQLAMIAGDFNWDDERLRTTKTGGAPNRLLKDVVGPQWNDAGQPFDYTYDGKENPMLGGNLRRRFDRCIYSCNNNNANTKGVVSPPSTTLRKLGMKAIPALTWNKKNPWNGTSKSVPVAPSDHFGIAITFDSS